PRLAVARQQTPARQLVARPLANDRAGEITDVVLVEDEDSAEPRSGERLARAAEAIGVQAPEVHALFEIHLHVAGRLERTIPPVAWIDVVGCDGSRERLLLAWHRGASWWRRYYREPTIRAQRRLLDVPGVLRALRVELEQDE